LARKHPETHTPGTGPRELHRWDEKRDDPADDTAVCRTIPRIFYSATGWGKGGSVQGGHRISRGRQPRRKGTPTRARSPFSRKIRWNPTGPKEPHPQGPCPGHGGGPTSFRLASLAKFHFPHSEVQGQGVGVRRLCGEAVRLRWLPNKSETSRPRLTIEGQPILLFRPIPPPAPCSPSPATACMRQADS